MNLTFFNMQISVGLHILNLLFAIQLRTVWVIIISHIPFSVNVKDCFLQKSWLLDIWTDVSLAQFVSVL